MKTTLSRRSNCRSENGSLDSMGRANQRWKKLLNEYEAPSLDQAIDEALHASMKTRKNELESARN